MSARIKVLSQDDNIVARLAELSIANKSVRTPRRALYLAEATDSESRMIKSNHVRGINEIYRNIRKEILDKIDGDVDKQQDFVSSVLNLTKKTQQKDEINFMIFSFDNDGEVPKKRHTEYLCDLLSAPFNDIIIPPIIPKLSGEQYLEFLKNFFAVLRTIKDKVIMGLIPYVSHLEIQTILDFYFKKDVNLLALDFNGKNPLSVYPNIRKIIRAIKIAEKEYRQHYYLHGINVSYGRGLDRYEAIPAKDILAFVMGFDSFGSSHVQRRMKPEIAEKLLKSKKKHVRLFSRQDYGYYRSDISDLKNVIPSETDAIVSLEDIRPSVGIDKLRRLQRVFNTERQGVEASNLHRVIQENRVKKYVESKSKVLEEIQTALKLKNQLL